MLQKSGEKKPPNMVLKPYKYWGYFPYQLVQPPDFWSITSITVATSRPFSAEKRNIAKRAWKPLSWPCLPFSGNKTPHRREIFDRIGSDLRCGDPKKRRYIVDPKKKVSVQSLLTLDIFDWRCRKERPSFFQEKISTTHPGLVFGEVWFPTDFNARIFFHPLIIIHPSNFCSRNGFGIWNKNITFPNMGFLCWQFFSWVLFTWNCCRWCFYFLLLQIMQWSFFYFFQSSCSNLSYTLENNMEPNITSYKPSFWGSMLVFEGVS